MKIKYVVLTVCILCGLLTCGCDDGKEEISLSSSPEVTEEMYSNSGESGDIYVYVKGAVKNPGVYVLDADARVVDLIDMAGGFKKNARKDYLNLAETLTDGQSVEVLTKKQYRKLLKDGQDDSLTSGSYEVDSDAGSSDDSSLININTASEEELTELSGIGDSKASAIVSYRDENGSFSSVEEITNVSGIGEVTYNNIKSDITV